MNHKFGYLDSFSYDSYTLSFFLAEDLETLYMMKQVKCGKNIWPDVSGTSEVNKFLERYGIKLDFLLDDGICFYVPDDLEVYQVSSDSCYFKDSMTKATILHYYESFGELILEGSLGNYTIPIFEDLENELKL